MILKGTATGRKTGRMDCAGEIFCVEGGVYNCKFDTETRIFDVEDEMDKLKSNDSEIIYGHDMVMSFFNEYFIINHHALDLEAANAQATADAIDADILENVIREAEADDQITREQARRMADAIDILDAAEGVKCLECEHKTECLEYTMTKVHTYDPEREDGSISQSAEKDEHLGLCSEPYVYDECDDCPCRIECLAGYLTESDKNDPHFTT